MKKTRTSWRWRASALSSSSPCSAPVTREPSPVRWPSTTPAHKKKRRKGKSKGKKLRWCADECMYTDLLEMRELSGGAVYWEAGTDDGLATDLGALGALVRKGKRCLAITYQGQSQGVGTVPNTSLRSRLLGALLLALFPLTLPPNTILDCILDARWRENGIPGPPHPRLLALMGRDRGRLQTLVPQAFPNSLPPHSPPPARRPKQQ